MTKMNKKKWALTGFLILFLFGFTGMLSAGWLSAINHPVIQVASGLSAANSCLTIIISVELLRKATK